MSIPTPRKAIGNSEGERLRGFKSERLKKNSTGRLWTFSGTMHWSIGIFIRYSFILYSLLWEKLCSKRVWIWSGPVQDVSVTTKPAHTSEVEKKQQQQQQMQSKTRNYVQHETLSTTILIYVGRVRFLKSRLFNIWYWLNLSSLWSTCSCITLRTLPLICLFCRLKCYILLSFERSWCSCIKQIYFSLL